MTPRNTSAAAPDAVAAPEVGWTVTGGLATISLPQGRPPAEGRTTPGDDAARGKTTRARRRLLPPALLDRPDAAAFLSISVSTLDRLNAAGEVPAPVRLGGRLAWGRRELSAWAARGCPDRAAWSKLWPLIRDRRPARK